MLLVGGTDPAQDVAAFKARGAHVLVGTPGRIEDTLKRCAAIDLRRLEVLVLDEADRLLDMGFKAQLDAVIARLPKQRRTGLFSATQTEAVQELARAGLRNPIRVAVAVTVGAAAAAAGKGAQGKGKEAEGKKAKKAKKGEDGEDGEGEEEEEEEEEEDGGAAEAARLAAVAAAAAGGVQVTPNSLSIQYLVCEPDEKMAQLVRFLRLHGPSRKAIVYAMTCAQVDHLAAALPRLPALRGVRLRALHGRMKQAAREATLEAFRALPAGVLLCTDLAARGLDIPDVHWILQLDAPQDPAAFVHRVGRTARMGRAGEALVLLAPHEEAYVEFLRLRKVPLTEAAPFPPTPLTTPAAGDGDDSAPSTSGRGAEAPSGPAPAGKKAGKGGKAAAKPSPAVKAANGAANGAAAATDADAAAAVAAAVAAGSDAVDHVVAGLRAAAERDRDVMDKAARAFVTYVRGYKEHHCKFIFRLQELNIGRLARGLGLLRLPKMPDLKRPLGLAAFKPSRVDPASVPYKDRAREKQRQKSLQERQGAAGVARAAEKAEAEAAAKAKRKAVAAAAEAEPRLPAAKRRQLQAKDEAEDINAEYSLLKKLRKGKITQHQYDVALGLSDGSEDEPDEQAGGKDEQQPGARAAADGADSDGAEAGADGAGDSGSDGEGDSSDGEEGTDARGKGGKGARGRGPGAGGKGQGGKRAAPQGPGGKGRGKGPGQAALGVRQGRGALQSYIDKKARKKKRQAARKAGGKGA
ncbi:hypothetical protein HYH03_009367 [Edaphochlamys debaryana]|uniref:ATP-dependent RNA helicase n=1 Tax=Edaphochlamys debaryana TaxID=47281 RepID=A0A835Y7I4_9CHLO|nr:hypothetical protein HYH03_009367 [Edaphochlamys debaryana]|eukprot:KAG2492424.1 hypothetical protein HYH03_009367 [Edaphochlamys debaryana]